MCKVPNFVAPVLQIDESQVGSVANDQFDSTAMESLIAFTQGSGFSQHSCFRTFIDDNERMSKIRSSIAQQTLDMNRLFDDDVAWHVKDRAR